jgi:hypothetical protein
MTFPLSSHTQPISQTFTMSPPWCYCWLWPLLRLDSPSLSILCVHNIYMYWMYVHVHIHTYQEVSLGTTTGIHAHPSYYSPNDEYHLYYFTTVFRSGWCPFPCAPLPSLKWPIRGGGTHWEKGSHYQHETSGTQLTPEHWRKSLATPRDLHVCHCFPLLLILFDTDLYHRAAS